MMNKFCVWFMSIILCLTWMSIGCGGRMKTEERRHRDIESHFNPFDYGDEFFQEVKDEKSGDGESARTGGRTTEDKRESKKGTPPKNVELQRLITPSIPQPSSKESVLGYRIQIGAFENKEYAEAAKEKVVSKFNVPVYIIYKAPFYRVRLGDFRKKSEAERYVKLLKEEGFPDARWVPANINAQE